MSFCQYRVLLLETVQRLTTPLNELQLLGQLSDKYEGSRDQDNCQIIEFFARQNVELALPFLLNRLLIYINETSSTNFEISEH